jgi:thiol-disulfide isomerase/thioredoxin
MIAALVLGGSGCNSKPASAQGFAHGALEKLEVRAAPPRQPPDSFEDRAGKQRTLADWRGRVVVVNLWATWCEPCKKEMPTLGVLAQAYKGKDVAVIAISVDKLSDRDLALATLAQLSKGQLDLYQAPSYDIAFNVDGSAFPTTIIYGRDGAEIARLAGGADWSSPEARGLIDWALAK